VGAVPSEYLSPNLEDASKSEVVEGRASRRGRGRRWIAAGLAAAVIAIGAFVMVQAGGGSGGPLNAIARAAEVTQHEPGGSAVVHATVTVANSPEGITEDGSMVFDDGGRSRGTFSFRGDSTGKEGTAEVIVDGETTYTSSDLFEGTLPEGKKWMKVDYGAAKPTFSSPVSADAGPEEGLKVLEDVIGAEEVGEEDVRGVPTTHYAGILPRTEEVFGEKVQFSAPHIDVWIDAQERVRRMEVVIVGSVSEDEPRATVKMSIDYLDFGQIPKIEPPDPDEVFDATGKYEAEIKSAAEGD